MELSLLDRFNNWVKESITVKLFSIGILILILLIPSFWVRELINERQSRAESVFDDISSKWAGNQTITGPVLMIPFKEVETVKEWVNGTEHSREVESVHNAFFLPDQLNITGTVSPEIRTRGIFEAAVYDSKLSVKASFLAPELAKLKIAPENVIWSDAKILFGITDLQGVYETPSIMLDGKQASSDPSANIGINIGHHSHTPDYNGIIQESVKVDNTSGIVISPNWTSAADMLKEFTIDLRLKGSKQLYFVPSGHSTSVDLAGAWPSPSFDGNMLPNTREVNEKGFTSSWKILSFNRSYADQWIDREQDMSGSEFGVRLVIPADQYQKSFRTAKYSILIILLAFTALFLVEITRKVRIHPFQYILVGAALIVYYTLLLSLSEHVGYNVAYGIASAATVTLLGLYSMSFLPTRGMVVLLSGVMSFFYVFIFVIIQAEDFSLLIGSVGLFVVIAVVMYFSRNIRWYNDASRQVQVTSAE